MHVISRKALRLFEADHPETSGALDGWYRLAKRAAWPHFAALRQDCPSADLVAPYIVFNVGGNRVRIIAEVFFADQVLLVRHVLTHADYDRGDWKT